MKYEIAVDALTLSTRTDSRPTQDEAEAAVRVLLRWAGENPEREGLRDTPARVARSYRELFAGYEVDPVALLERTFEEVDGYDEIILLRDIRLESYCEHHMVPIIGRAMSPICPATASSASASWRVWWTPTPSACRSRRS